MRLGRHQRWLGVLSRHDQEIGMLPQVMKPRLTRTCITAADSRKDAQPAEVGIYRRVAEVLM